METQVPWNVNSYISMCQTRIIFCSRKIKHLGNYGIYLRSSKDPVTNVVTCSTSSRKCTRKLPGFNNCSTTLLDSSYELPIQPKFRMTVSETSSKPKILHGGVQFRQVNLNFKKTSLYHSSSLTSSRTGFSPADVLTVAWLTSGYCVEEWFPQIMTFLTSETGTFNLSEICPRALLWSNLVKQVTFFAGIDGANSFRINALVLAGLATTKTWKSCKHWVNKKE